MKTPDFDLNGFMQVLDDCEGQVYMVTEEGDRLNLKSKLCQLIGFTTLIEGGAATSARIECENKGDEARLAHFNLFEDTTAGKE